jgi:hypothetical protein
LCRARSEAWSARGDGSTNRREVLTLAARAALLGAAGVAAGAVQGSSPGLRREYYELRQYHVRVGSQSKITLEYFREALVPALNRSGVAPVGVFSSDLGGLGPSFYVLMPAKDVQTLVMLEARLNHDAEYNKAGAPFLSAPSAQPAFQRIDSALMVAFEGWPQLQVPSASSERQTRVFELRTYESPSDQDHRRKVEMFDSGQYAAFQKAGFRPIFFGDVLVGARRPCLVYMLGMTDLGQRAAMWQFFLATEEWKKLASDPRYGSQEVTSKVHSAILYPVDISQI